MSKYEDPALQEAFDAGRAAGLREANDMLGGILLMIDEYEKEHAQV